MYGLFDIGGTNTRVAISEDGRSLAEPDIVRTPETPKECVALIGTLLQKRMRPDAQLTAVAGGIAGVLHPNHTHLISAPNLEAFVDYPITQELRALLDTRLFLENDAALAALAEATNGAGKDATIVGYLTLGTGFGGARVVTGTHDASQYGAEPGKQLIPVHDELRTLESLVSGRAVERETGKKPKEIQDMHFWSQKATLFALGAHNAVALWSPQVLVLGGSMIVTEGDGRVGISVEEVGERLRETITFAPAPPVCRAFHGDVGVLHGALAFLESNVQKFS